MDNVSEKGGAGTGLNIAVLMMNAGRGSGVVARQHAKGLLSHGHKVTIMHPGIKKEDRIEGAENIDIDLGDMITPVHEDLPRAGKSQKPVSSMSYDEAIEYLPYYEKALENVIGNTDLIIGHHANISAVAVHNVAKRHNKPYLLFVHGTGIEPRHGYHGPNKYDDRVWNLIETSIKEADGILVTTEYVRDELIKPLVDLPDDAVFVLPIGVDLETYTEGNVGEIRARYDLPEKYVICPGALTELKGPMNVAIASRQYADLAKTYFTGGGPLEEALKEELGDRGGLLGFVPDMDKAQLINAATLLTAAPEKKEHFGIIYAEALAASTPIVAYEGGGVNSIVTRDVGVLTERTSKALGAEIRKALEDDEGRRRMADAARRRAEEHFDAEKLADDLNDWITGIVKGAK